MPNKATTTQQESCSSDEGQRLLNSVDLGQVAMARSGQQQQKLDKHSSTYTLLESSQEFEQTAGKKSLPGHHQIAGGARAGDKRADRFPSSAAYKTDRK